MTPSIRPFAPFLVGSFKLDYKKFLFFDLLACSVWVLGLVLLVVLWDSIGSLFDVTIISLVLLIGLGIML